MGGGDNAHIRLDAAGGTERHEGLFLQHPQEPHLEGRGNIADFIQKQRALFRQREAALAVPAGVGKRAGRVAEKLGFQEGVGKGAAVDRHKGALGPPTQAMEGPGHQFLAGAAFPFDEHGAVGAGHLGQEGENFLHPGRLGNDVPQAIAALDFFAQFLHQAQVPKGLHPADDLAGIVFEQRGADADGDLLAVGPEDGNGLIYHRTPRIQRVPQNAG